MDLDEGTLEDSDEDDLTSVMLSATSLGEDLVDEVEDLVFAKAMTSNKHSLFHLKKHISVSRKRSDIIDESWPKELPKKAVRPVTVTERFSNRHRHRLE